jgi:hypothetical protein
VLAGRPPASTKGHFYWLKVARGCLARQQKPVLAARTNRFWPGEWQHDNVGRRPVLDPPGAGVGDGGGSGERRIPGVGSTNNSIFPKKQETKWISALFGYTTPRIACSNPKRRRQWRGEEEKLGQEAVGVIGEKREGGVGDAAGVGGGGVAMDLAPGVVRRRCGVMAATDNDDAAS